jgi:4-hydroxy-tetrahydrodipicolinate reductase
MIDVAVAGAMGRMGGEVIEAVNAAEDMRVVAGVDVKADGLGRGGFPISHDLRPMISVAHPQVLVDFTVADAAVANALAALEMGVRPVIGTSGISQQDLDSIERRAAETKTGAFIAPNFALGAVLMMHFARIGARYFDSAEIIELHHDQKIDAPSGTAVKTAQEMAEAHAKAFATNVPDKEPLPGGRGAVWEGVRIHSVRLPGLVAHQEVIFGALGQTLVIRHDTSDRTAFMPGVLIAIREVVKLDRLVVGLDNLLGLG